MAHKQQKLISNSSGGSKSKIRVPASSSAGRTLFQTEDCWLFLTWQKERNRALWRPFLNALILLMRTPHSWPNYLPKVHLLIPSLEVKNSTYELRGGHKHSVHGISFSILCEENLSKPTTSLRSKLNNFPSNVAGEVTSWMTLTMNFPLALTRYWKAHRDDPHLRLLWQRHIAY